MSERINPFRLDPFPFLGAVITITYRKGNGKHDQSLAYFLPVQTVGGFIEALPGSSALIRLTIEIEPKGLPKIRGVLSSKNS